MHPGEEQLLVSKSICKLSLQPSPTLYPELNPERRAAPCSAPGPPFLCQEHHPVASWPWLSPSETVIKLKHLKGKKKSEACSCAQSCMDKLGINPGVLIV